MFQLEESETEILLPDLSAETQRLVEQIMKKDGYAIYKTSAKTQMDARDEGMKF